MKCITMLKINFTTISLIIISFQLCFSQESDLIIGELSGRVDYHDVEQLIRLNYYPVFQSTEEYSLRIIKNSPAEVIFEYLSPLATQPSKLIVRFFNSEMTLVAVIITDEIDFAKTESASMANEVHKTNPSIRVMFQHKPDHFVKMLAYNNQHPILRSVNVRRALSCAINKNYILTRLLNQQADIAIAPVNKDSKLYDTGFREYKYNLKNAINLLKEDGWHDLNQDGVLEKDNIPLRFQLVYEQGVLPDEDMVRIIKLDWNKIGIDVAVKPLLKAEIKKILRSNRFDAILINHQFEETIVSLANVFSSKGSDNFMSYNNQRIDRFFELAQQADTLTRNNLLKGILNIVIQEQPVSFLFFLWLDWYFVNAAKFENFTDENNELRPLNKWKLKP